MAVEHRGVLAAVIGRAVWLAFAVALIVRLAIALTSTHVPVVDETGYRDTAHAIASGRGHVLDGAVTFKAPLYPAMLSVVYRAGGGDRAARVLQAVLGASLTLLAGWFGGLVLTRTAGAVAAWATAVYPVFVALTPRLLAEALFVWLVTAALACAAWLMVRPDWRRAALLGAVCGLVALTRSAGIGLAIVLAAASIAAIRSVPLRERLVYAAAVVLVCGVVVAPWTVRNWLRLHAFVPVATEFGRNLYSGWVSVPQEKIFGGTAVDATTRQADAIGSELARDRFLQQKAIEYIGDNPRLIPRYAALKTLYFWSPLDWDVLGGGNAVYNGIYVALVPFMLIGTWHARARAPMALWAVLPVLGYFWAIALLGSTTPRYRYPIEPALFALAGFGIAAFCAGQWRRRLAVVTPWIALNAVGIAFSAPIKAALRATLVGAGIW